MAAAEQIPSRIGGHWLHETIRSSKRDSRHAACELSKPESEDRRFRDTADATGSGTTNAQAFRTPIASRASTSFFLFTLSEVRI
jgi:hypothetical protein